MAQNSVKFINIDGFKNTQAVIATGVKNSFTRHVHAHLCLVRIDKGVRKININGNITRLCPGNMIAICPNQSHKTTTVKKENYRVVSFGDELYDMDIGQFPSPLPVNYNLQNYFELFFHTLARKHSSAQIQSLTVKLLTTLLTLHTNTPAPHQTPHTHCVVEKVKTIINSSPSKTPTLAQLAATTKVSPFYLQRLFLAHTGQTPHEFALTQHIKNACKQLLANHPITQTALENGFADQSHMTRVFKQITGTTPAQFVTDNKTNTK